jgi:outer membrane biogenesis lipoprotein LolB
MDNSDIDMLQTDLNRLGEWTVENEMKYIQSSKRVSFRKTWVKERIRYYFGDQLIPEVSTFNI